jgi:FtsZ-interacting cell division protein ZipA
MSLQLSLVVLGAVLVAAVIGYNWLQERRYRKKVEQAFTQLERDVLLDVPSHLDLDQGGTLGARRLQGGEPDTEAKSAVVPEAVPAVAPDIEPPAPAPVEEPTAPGGTVDAVVLLEADAPLSEAALTDLLAVVGTLPRPSRLSGFDPGTAAWVELVAPASGRYRRVRTEMQLANRQGVTTRGDLEAFVRAVQAVADRIGARATPPDLDAMARRAAELDALCADVDIAIGLTVAAKPGRKLPGKTIRTLAQGAGLKLKADGQFHAETPSGAPQFTVDNQESEPFFEDSMDGLATQGVTFLLDVPRVADGVAAFDRMVATARAFASTLDADVVDDNRRPLSDAGLDAIRRHLAEVSARMSAAGIPAGSPVALRLFA